MLTLFIVKTSGKYSNWRLLMSSFKGVALSEVCYVRDVREINEKLGRIGTEWYGVFHDNEYIQPQLARVLDVFLGSAHTCNVLSVYKREADGDRVRVYQVPRFFKKYVALQEDCMLPREELTAVTETVLDGWVFSNSDIYLRSGVHAIS